MSDNGGPAAPGRRHRALPPSLPPRGLNREQAAQYVGVSASKFDEMVADGRMPNPRVIDGRVVWDLWELDEAFSALPHRGGEEGGDNPWNEVEPPRGTRCSCASGT